MFWFLYIFSALLLSSLATMFSKKYNMLLFYIFSVILLTPAQIEIGSEGYAPALFSFLFNVFLEQDYSLRALRPLALTIPTGLLIFLLFFLFKRRFF